MLLLVLLLLLLSLFHLLLSISQGMSIFNAGFGGLPEPVRCSGAEPSAGTTVNSELNLTDGGCCCSPAEGAAGGCSKLAAGKGGRAMSAEPCQDNCQLARCSNTDASEGPNCVLEALPPGILSVLARLLLLLLLLLTTCTSAAWPQAAPCDCAPAGPVGCCLLMSAQAGWLYTAASCWMLLPLLLLLLRPLLLL
jgi:hypothetical protein